jgi:hypothetical protein
MTTSIRRHVLGAGTFVATLVFATPALAQKVTTVPDLTGKQVLEQLANQGTGGVSGDAVAFATALEIGTAPFGTSSGGFVFKLDPSTGLLARTTTSFGPSFVERALTSGEGKVAMGATFSSTNYDKLSDFGLTSLPMGFVQSTNPLVTGTTTGNLRISSTTIAISGTVGVTPKIDVGVVVPLVTVKLSGLSTTVNGNGVVSRLVETDNKFSGIGDIAAAAKFRVAKFKGPDVPDPGGMAVNVLVRLPTGDPDNLRGLGIGRTLASLVASFGVGPIKPHGSVGFEFWNKPFHVGPDTIRHQFQYNGGVEIVAAPKMTILADVLGQKILGAGPVELSPVTPIAGAGITAAQALVFQDGSIDKLIFIPGLKVNLKGKFVLSLNALVTMKNNGLHSKVTPVAGINLTM